MPPDRRWRFDLSWLGLGRGGARVARPEVAQSPLVAFHCHDGEDHAGRRHADILEFDDDALHGVHDLIQWLFPLPEASRAFNGAPVLTEADLEVMRRSGLCQERLAAARERMITFLNENPDWLQAYDHNHLRITRMIRSTRLIAGHEAGDALRDFFLHHIRERRGMVNPTTLAFWANA
jgi:hypothetical protein